MTRTFTFRSLAVAACGASLGLIGCEHVGNTAPLSLSPSTMQVDEAMQAREWDRASAVYSNGSTVAGPIARPYTLKPNLPPYAYAGLDTPLFLGNVALLPYVFFKTPPFAPVEWKGESIEPTYTGTPPLPPE